MLSLLALGCATPMPVATAPALAPAAAPGDATGVLTGQATLPEEMVDASHVIPTGIGRVIPTGQGRYRLQQTAFPGELPVTGALVTLRDVATRQALAGVEPVRTDAGGAFTIPGVPMAGNVLIEVAFTLPGQPTAYRLLSVGRAAAGYETGAVAVTWRSTAVVAHALSAPGSLDLLTVGPEAMRAAELAEAERLSSLNPAQRQATLTETLAGALLGTLLPTPGPSPTPQPVPSTGLAPVSAPSVIGAIASPLPGVLDPVTGVVTDTAAATQGVVADTTEAAGETVGAVTEGAGDTTESVVETVTGTTTAVVGGTLGLLPGASATPTSTPASTPTSAPTAKPLITLPGLGGIGL